MATMVPPQKGVQYIFYVGLVSQADTKLLKANPTIAAGDFKVSTDGGAFANLGTLPTVTPAAGTAVKITLSTTEMNGDNIIVTCIDAAGAEWCDLLINIQTSAQSLDTMDTNIDAIKAKTDNLKDSWNDITAAAVKTAIEAVGSHLALIKAQTDDLADGQRLDLLIDAITGYVDLIDDATNGLAAIKAEVEGLGGEAMRGTNSAALASAWTAARATYLDNLSAGAAALEATLTAIKGTTWSDETLKAIKDAVDAITITAAAIADAVWDELTADHETALTFGKAVVPKARFKT